MARLPFSDHLTFFREFRQRFKTTGAIAPSSRFLASAMLGPLKKTRKGPTRILEIGPGTGAVTQQLVKQVQPGDVLDLVELNENFADLLKKRFAEDTHYKKVAEQSEVHICPLQDFETTEPYDFIISGLPLNNFSEELVSEIFELYFQLLAPGGVLSYFEYMYIRPLRRVVSGKEDKTRLKGLDTIMNGYLDKHRYRRSWVFVNFPPAWVQHLRNTENEPVAS